MSRHAEHPGAARLVRALRGALGDLSRACASAPYTHRVHILCARPYRLLVGISEERHARTGSRRTAHVFAEHLFAGSCIGSVRKTPSLVTPLTSVLKRIVIETERNGR